jgi:hypothetical protein
LPQSFEGCGQTEFVGKRRRDDRFDGQGCKDWPRLELDVQPRLSRHPD